MLPYYPPQIENGFYIAGFDLTALQEGNLLSTNKNISLTYKKVFTLLDLI